MVKKIENILIKSEKFRLPGQNELKKIQAAMEVIVIDVTETEIERPKKNGKKINFLPFLFLLKFN